MGAPGTCEIRVLPPNTARGEGPNQSQASRGAPLPRRAKPVERGWTSGGEPISAGDGHAEVVAPSSTEEVGTPLPEGPYGGKAVPQW